MESSSTGTAPQPFIVKTISGLEQVLANELIELGAENVQILTRAVSFEGDKRLLYKANYCLRTGLRILVPLFSFQMADEDDLYNQINAYPWENYLSLLRTLAVDAVVSGSELTHSHYVALRTKDAIVDHFRTISNGRRPNVDTENPDVRVNIHIKGSICNVSIDSSGASLHKRGYRVSNAEAPMSEVLAAGLILLSGWKRDCNFIDPMCGSGTLLIEAALYANNFPAGMYRKDFGFMHWPDFDLELFNEVSAEALDQQLEFEHLIMGSDISPKNMASARANIKSAKLHKDIKLTVSPFAALEPPPGTPGIIIINPPYGERIRSNDIIGLYKSIGNTLKQEFAGYQAWIISSDQRALSMIGLRPSAKIPIFNGPLECRFEHFDLYKGSKRGRYMDSEGSSFTEKNEYVATDDKPNWRRKDAPEGEFDSLNPKPREFNPQSGNSERSFPRRERSERGAFEKRESRNPDEQSEYKSREFKPREHKLSDNNSHDFSKKDKFGEGSETRRTEKPFRGKNSMEEDKANRRKVEKVKLKPITRIEDRNEYINSRKNIIEAEGENAESETIKLTPLVENENVQQREPSKGNKFTEQRDSRIMLTRELRPRKRKSTESEPEQQKIKPETKILKPEPKEPKTPVNFDDLED